MSRTPVKKTPLQWKKSLKKQVLLDNEDMAYHYFLRLKSEDNPLWFRGWNWLHFAAYFGSLSVFRSFVDRERICINITTDREGDTPLHIASKRGQLSILSFLIDRRLFYGVRFSLRNRFGERPIDVALNDEVRSLLSPVIELEKAEKQGRTSSTSSESSSSSSSTTPTDSSSSSSFGDTDVAFDTFNAPSGDVWQNDPLLRRVKYRQLLLEKTCDITIALKVAQCRLQSAKSDLEDLRKKYLITESDIRIGSRIGGSSSSTGEFGVVEKAVWEEAGGGAVVAVKTVQIDDEVRIGEEETESEPESEGETQQEVDVDGRSLQIVELWRDKCNCFHPNVLRAFGFVRNAQSGTVRFVIEKVWKNSLAYVKDSQITLDNKIGIMKQMASGMCYLHHRVPVPIIHGRVKGENFLVTSRGVVKVCDFGMRKIYDLVKRVPAVPVPSSEAERVVVREFLAPEIVESRQHTIASDLYALGMLYYEILTGRKPFEAEVDEGVEYGPHVAGLMRDGQRPDYGVLSELYPGEAKAKVVERLILLMEDLWKPVEERCDDALKIVERLQSLLPEDEETEVV